MFVQAPGGDVTNSGYIGAAQVELRSNGGNIYALAGNNGGQIRATGTATRGGHVWLIAENGTTNVSGLISAANVDGTGGAIETSGAHVGMAGAAITTGKGGNWLLDPNDITIDPILAATIQTSLNGGTNVTEQTTASGTGGSGDINVNSSIAWSTAASLTLSAYRNINVNSGVAISNSGAGTLTLYADNAATGTGTVAFNGTGNVNFTGGGNVNLYYHPTAYPTATSYSSNVTTGTGTFTPYMTVDSMADLQNVNSALTSNYALNTNLNASSTSGFVPIGETGSFSGVFDGQGHIINNLTINSTLNSVALFAINSGVVENLGLVNENVSSGPATSYTGGLVGENIKTISNSFVSGNVTGSHFSIGGLVGLNACCPGPNGAIIQSSYSSGTVTGTGALTYTGGLAGASYATVNNSYSTSTVNSVGTLGTGGLLGSANGSISNSYSAGKVSGASNVGGFIGYDYSPALSNTYWVTDIPGQTANGFGFGSSAGLSGITSAALKSGSFPVGLSSPIWSTYNGLFPYLTWQGPLVTISGTAYTGSSVIGSASVQALAGGSLLASLTTNSSGLYSFSEPSNVLGGGVLTYLTSNGTANTFSNSANGFTGMDLHVGTLSLINGSSATLSGLSGALNTTLGTTTGANILFTVPSGVLTLKNATNLSLVSSAPAFTINQPITSGGSIFINSTGSGALTIANASGLTAGEESNVVLVTGGAFTNNDGASALNVSAGGRWLVYSQNPANDTLDGLSENYKVYNATYGITAASHPGNAVFYTLAPIITPTLTGSADFRALGRGGDFADQNGRAILVFQNCLRDIVDVSKQPQFADVDLLRARLYEAPACIYVIVG